MLKNRFVRYAALAALVALAAWYVRRHWASLRQEASQFDPAYVLPLVGVHLLTLGLNGWINRDLVGRLGVRLSAGEWYGLSAVTSLGNYFPVPQAGPVARGMYLKRRHRLPYGPYAATVLFTYVFSLALLGFVGLAGLSAVRAGGGRVGWPLWAAFAGLAAALVLLTPAANRLLPGQRLATLRQGMNDLLHSTTILRVAACKLLLIAANATGIWLAYRSLGQGQSWPAALVVALAAMASGVVNVTPGNAGAAEATAWVTAHFLRADADLAVTMYLVYRATQAIVVFTLGPVFLMVLARTPKGAGGGVAPVAVPGEALRSE